MYFDNNPDKIIYQIIKDKTAALTALKGEKLDVMIGLKAKDYTTLIKDESFTKKFQLKQIPTPTYTYVGVNTKSACLTNPITRQALAHTINVDNALQTINYGIGERIIGTVHPSDSFFYNHNIIPYRYDLAKAKNLLKQAGWADNNSDGILDQKINGKQINLELNFLINQETAERKSLALLFQEEARKVGIKVTIESREWSTYMKIIKNHDFDLYYGAWTLDNGPGDPNQLFHTNSINGGSNYCSFGNTKTDALIDSIGITLNPNDRQKLWYRFQEIMHQNVPYIFMYAPTMPIAINKRISNTYTSTKSPGYWEAGFTFKSDEI